MTPPEEQIIIAMFWESHQTMQVSQVLFRSLLLIDILFSGHTVKHA